MSREPFGYIVQDGRDGDIIASGRTLTEAVRGLDSPDYGFGWTVLALVGTEQIGVPKSAYAVPDPPTEEVAIGFVRERAKAIAAGSVLASLRGVMRCDPDDDEAKQVADYRRTAPWRVRAEPDEMWWQNFPLPAGPTP